VSWGDEGHEESGEEAYAEHGDAMHAYGTLHGDAMHAYAAAGGHDVFHAECTSICQLHGSPADHGHAVWQGGQHLTSFHDGATSGVRIVDNQHGQYYWYCEAPCGFVGRTRGSQEEAELDVEEHILQHPRHQANVSVSLGRGDDS
jgi:hypothetical protein